MLPFGIGFSELVVIAIVVLLVVGPHKLPEVARTLGKAVRVVRKAAQDLRSAVDIEEVQSMKREFNRSLHDWQSDLDAATRPVQDVTPGPDGVLRPVPSVQGPPEPPAAKSTAVVAVAPIAVASQALGEDAPEEAGAKTGADTGAEGGALSAQAAWIVAEARGEAAEEAQDDDDEEDPDEAAPPVSVVRHDPFFERLQAQVAHAHVQATAGHVEDEPAEPDEAAPGESQGA